MENEKKLEFPLEAYTDDNFRENFFKGRTFQEFAAKENQEKMQLTEELLRGLGIPILFNESYGDKNDILGPIKVYNTIKNKVQKKCNPQKPY